MRHILPTLSLSMMLILGFSNTSTAGHSVGGGGAGILCHAPHGSEQSIELYDYFEAKRVNQAVIDLGTGSSYKDLADVALTRLTRLSPRRAQRYRDQIQTFEQDAAIIYDSSLFPVPDLGPGAIEPPPGCSLVQLAYQREPQFPGEKRYRVNGELWRSMSELTKAGLVLHEVIYREAMAYGLENSIGTRFFNATFAQKSSEQLSAQDFFAILRGIPFLWTDILGADVRIGFCYRNELGKRTCRGPDDIEAWIPFISFHPSGNLREFMTQQIIQDNTRFPFCSPQDAIRYGANVLRLFYTPGETPRPFYCGEKISFYDQLNLTPSSIEQDRESLSAFMTLEQGDEVISAFWAAKMAFYPEGQVSEIWGPDMKFRDGHNVEGKHKVFLKADGNVDRIEPFTDW